MAAIYWGLFSIFQMGRYLRSKGGSFAKSYFNPLVALTYLSETLNENGKPGIWFFSLIGSVVAVVVTIAVAIATNA